MAEQPVELDVDPQTLDTSIVADMSEKEKNISNNCKPAVRITYYPFHGRAAALRATCAFGGICYQENFITIPQQIETKANGGRRWSGPPELTIFDGDGEEVVTIGQSNACLRYLGNVCGLYQTDNPCIGALIDEVLDSLEDISALLSPSLNEKDKDKKKEMRLALMEDDKLPYWMDKLTNRLKENKERGNKNGFIVGDSITIADLKLFYGIHPFMLGNIDFIDAKSLIDPYPELKAFYNAMGNNEKIKKFNNSFKSYQMVNREKKVTHFISCPVDKKEVNNEEVTKEEIKKETTKEITELENTEEPKDEPKEEITENTEEKEIKEEQKQETKDEIQENTKEETKVEPKQENEDKQYSQHDNSKLIAIIELKDQQIKELKGAIDEKKKNEVQGTGLNDFESRADESAKKIKELENALKELKDKVMKLAQNNTSVLRTAID